ncbi:MAG: GNAT family N-acetyltransferase [Erysipelotrichaceae bacterium]|nr:GNAT family N-acetyltransferase [Erysipelotrichaceae bacterium]
METERLLIDAIRESDREDYFRCISHDIKVLETFICRYAENLEDFDIRPYVHREDILAIRLRETGRLIGILCCFDVRENESCEIGYGIGSDYWNRGYATEAVNKYIDYLFREKNMKTVYASFFPENASSKRVMEKCGMKYSFTREKELTYLGRERDLVYYRIFRDELT